MIKTVVFDLGGTLIEYAGSYQTWPELETPGFQAAFASLNQNGYAFSFAHFKAAGFSLLPQLWQAAIRHEKNLQVVDLIAQSLKANDIDYVNKTDVEEAADRYGEAIQAQAYVVDTAVSTVQQIKAAGYQVGLVSNTMFPGSPHRADLARFGLLEYFDAMVFSADLFKWKPNADPFLHVLAELGAAAETAVYIGDDPASDVVGGHAAGMRTIYFKANKRFHKAAGIEPHAEIKHLNELMPTLAAW